MTSRARPIPEGHDRATPYLCVRDAAGAIEFYRKAFGATELMRLTQPDGKIGHAEIKIGAAPIMLADEFPEMGFRGPQSLGGSPVTIQLYGDRSGTLADPFGHVWMIATHREDVSAEEMQKRFAALYG